MTKKMLTRCLMSVLILLGPAAGQQMAVGLGSPNTRDSMSYADAKVSLRSFEETNFVAVADRIVCALAPRGSVTTAIGEIHEQGKLGVSGAENSVVVKASLSLEEMRYAMALLGRYARTGCHAILSAENGSCRHGSAVLANGQVHRYQAAAGRVGGVKGDDFGVDGDFVAGLQLLAELVEHGLPPSGGDCDATTGLWLLECGGV